MQNTTAITGWGGKVNISFSGVLHPDGFPRTSEAILTGFFSLRNVMGWKDIAKSSAFITDGIRTRKKFSGAAYFGAEFQRFI